MRKFAFDPLLFRRADTHIGAVLATATLGDVFPILSELDRYAVIKRDGRVLGAVERPPEARFLRVLQFVVAVVAASERGFQDHHLSLRIFRGELPRLFADLLRLGKLPCVDPLVVFLDEIGELTLDPHLRLPFAVE